MDKKRKKIIILWIVVLAIIIVLILCLKHINKANRSHYEHRRLVTTYPKNYEVIKECYDIPPSGSLFCNIDSRSLSKLSNISLYYKPALGEYIDKSIDIQNGMIDLRLNQKKIMSKNSFWDRYKWVYNIYKYDDNGIIEIISYSDREEWETEYEKVYKEERKKLYDELIGYEGVRNGNEISELIGKIFDYSNLHILESDKQATPMVKLLVYDNEELVIKESTIRNFYDREQIKAQGVFRDDLKMLYGMINLDKEHIVKINRVYDGIDEVIIEYHLSRNLLGRENYY